MCPPRIPLEVLLAPTATWPLDEACVAVLAEAAAYTLWVTLERLGAPRGLRLPVLAALVAGPLVMAVGSSTAAYEPFVRTVLAAVAASAVCLVGAPALARRRQGRVTLAGWLVVPLVAIAWTGLGFAGWVDDLAHHLARVDARHELWARVVEAGTRWLASLWVALGLIVGATAFRPAVACRATSVRLAGVGALLVCVGGVVEAHRIVGLAWWSDQWSAAVSAWAFRERMLWAAVGVAAWTAVRARRAGPLRHGDGPRVVAAMVVLGALVAGSGGVAVQALARAVAEGDVARMLAAPRCPQARCEGGVRAFAPMAAYPVFGPSLAVIEVRVTGIGIPQPGDPEVPRCGFRAGAM
ncbi:MAG: hypothetical protein H6733_04395 [Alphaproteobacteria bacterium]|nr:hypothetical protein [Alphaproteobacteria bacterium]